MAARALVVQVASVVRVVSAAEREATAVAAAHRVALPMVAPARVAIKHSLHRPLMCIYIPLFIKLIRHMKVVYKMHIASFTKSRSKQSACVKEISYINR